MRRLWISAIALAIAEFSGTAESALRPPPVIDMHLHAGELSMLATPGLEILPGVIAAQSTDDLRRATLAALDEHNVVVAVVSGQYAEQYRAKAPVPLLASPLLTNADEPIGSLRASFRNGRYQALAEFAPQYAGLAPNDPALEPYFALAEELDVPLGIHIGPGAQGVAYGEAPAYRMIHSNPLLLEDVLVRHPKLRLYVMHAGYPMIDELIGLLWAHPQVHADVAMINWVLPRNEFHRYLKRIVDAGFADRVMFGSDQMAWPGAIAKGIESIQSAPFLDEAQKRGILCGNAARFLRLDASICERT